MNDIKLDICCGQYKADGYIGIDVRDIDGVDIIHNVQDFPWPLSDSCCTHIRMHLAWACIEPKYRIKLMDEMWRIAKPKCVLEIREVHSLAPCMTHDPLYYSGASEWTFLYFEPIHEKYKVYEPKPWHIVEYIYNPQTVVEVKMEPIKCIRTND